MTADRDLGRRLAGHFAAEAPRRAPEWVLTSALTTIAGSRQRRGPTARWRFTGLYAALGAAAVALAIVVVGMLQFSSIGRPTPGPSTVPSSTVDPAASPPPGYSLPALTQTFTSRINGVSMSYPAGWEVTIDSRPWDPSPGTYREPTGDVLFDPARADVLLKVASQSLGGTTFDQWSTTVLVGRGCAGSTAPMVIDGVLGLLDSSCLTAVVASGGRGYVIVGQWNYELPELRTVNWPGWFREVLATVDLRPAEAVSGPHPTLVPGSTLGPTHIVELTARDIAFTATTLDAPANAPIVIRFTNADPASIVHVVDLRRSDGLTIIKEQKPIDGGTTTDFAFDALPPGTYVLMCNIHPIVSMQATLTIR